MINFCSSCKIIIKNQAVKLYKIKWVSYFIKEKVCFGKNKNKIFKKKKLREKYNLILLLMEINLKSLRLMKKLHPYPNIDWDENCNL